MLESSYHLDSSPNFLDFEFVSIGPNGHITKIVRYRESEVDGLYELRFGDRTTDTDYIDDLSVSNNGDTQKVLVTVAQTLYLFFEKYPEVNVVWSGSTISRTRLYRIAITSRMSIIQQDFEVLGLSDTKWERFRKNETYHAFLVRRKL